MKICVLGVLINEKQKKKKTKKKIKIPLYLLLNNLIDVTINLIKIAEN